MPAPQRILFACVGNAFRSQIAEGFARTYARRGTVDIRSGGTNPSGFVHPGAIRVMAEKGIDISKQASKPIDLEFAAVAERFITLCGPLDAACPARIAKRAVDWNIHDPSWGTEDDQRRIRDEIEGRVKQLLRDLGALDGRHA